MVQMDIILLNKNLSPYLVAELLANEKTENNFMKLLLYWAFGPFIVATPPISIEILLK